ncbi:hypothetical protein Tco_0508476 [Tanacetum coccineum]
MARRGIIWETPEVTISLENDQQKNGENGESFTRIETCGDDMDNSNQVRGEASEKHASAWDDPKVQGMKNSFVSVVTNDKPKPKVNFRTLVNENKVENSDTVLPMDAIVAAQNKFANSLVGFFVGKTIAFPLVKNYVTNTWGKYGFKRVIKDDDGFYFFQFTSQTGLEQVLEQGPWMIRNTPIMLNKWSPNMSLTKDKVTKVPVWVKMHKVPIVAYYEDGPSLIATQVGTPIMLDTFTSDMCADPWGRLGFARALIEVSVDQELKQEVIMVVPKVDGTGHTMECIRMEYEWKPPLCLDCHVFGHNKEQCPKRVMESAPNSKEVQTDGFTMVSDRKKNGKAKEHSNDQPHKKFGGVKLPKPNTFVYRPKVANTKDKGEASNKNTGESVKLKNSFDALATSDEQETDMSYVEHATTVDPTDPVSN